MSGLDTEPDGFSTQFPEMFDAAYRAARRVGGSRQTAEDAASEALYRAAVRWSRVQPYCVPWVVRVATNLVLDEHRKVRRRISVVDTPRVEADDAQADQRIVLIEALRELPPRQREVVVLRYMAGFSEADTADALQISAGAVKSHASRGLSHLRKELPTVY